MKTPEEHAVEILEWLNFDSTLCCDWVLGIAELIAARDAEHAGLNALELGAAARQAGIVR